MRNFKTVKSIFFSSMLWLSVIGNVTEEIAIAYNFIQWQSADSTEKAPGIVRT